ncbi:hypothetical protein F5879DRAFT_973409 [Lentinula edodes]|uniref:uncharacterized protein n=1 Tax=Lentinula edodes TaxID=5353 RepID=UPI001E8CD2D6|nr:uncharacterized protein C8R40DRAFT_651174 [Lentinula edodes]KAH7870306.1 hypothetical protein C8R40DRAFT_651174 [Lentinula edodes]KAJ3900276.1 hypothetical protein F5879DRAFT_973409 [Lentinula edodes]
MHLKTVYFVLGLGFFSMVWMMPLSSNTINRRAPDVYVTVIPDKNSRASQDVRGFLVKGLEYTLRKMPELGLGSPITVSPQRVQISLSGVNFQIHSASSLLGTGNLKTNF